jgi:DNA polymerase IV
VQEFSTNNDFPRAILHIDGDAFFVGVEVAKNPLLRGKAVVTGEERGIVSALSYEAKALGVTRGMPIFKLKKLFPSVLVLPGDYASYEDYSQRMFDIVRRYADDVEEYSIDECFADLTGFDKPLRMSYREIIERIKREVHKELDISVSVGLAPTKVLAKVASKWVKPNGLTIIDSAHINDFLATVPVHKVWGIGPQTSQFLTRQNIRTALDLARQTEAWVEHFLDKHVRELWAELRGVTVFKVDPYAKTVYSSIQKTHTFHPPSGDVNFLLSQLSGHVEDACAKARYYNLAPRKISFFLKTQTFHYYRHEIKLLSPTNLPELLIPIIAKEFGKVYKKGIRYRSAGVTLQDLVDSSVVQADLFGDNIRADKFDTIHKQIESLEDKFGKRVVTLASSAEVKPRHESRANNRNRAMP